MLEHKMLMIGFKKEIWSTRVLTILCFKKVLTKKKTKEI